MKDLSDLRPPLPEWIVDVCDVLFYSQSHRLRMKTSSRSLEREHSMFFIIAMN